MVTSQESIMTSVRSIVAYISHCLQEYVSRLGTVRSDTQLVVSCHHVLRKRGSSMELLKPAESYLAAIFISGLNVATCVSWQAFGTAAGSLFPRRFIWTESAADFWQTVMNNEPRSILIFSFVITTAAIHINFLVYYNEWQPVCGHRCSQNTEYLLTWSRDWQLFTSCNAVIRLHNREF